VTCLLKSSANLPLLLSFSLTDLLFFIYLGYDFFDKCMDCKCFLSFFSSQEGITWDNFKIMKFIYFVLLASKLWSCLPLLVLLEFHPSFRDLHHISCTLLGWPIGACAEEEAVPSDLFRASHLDPKSFLQFKIRWASCHSCVNLEIIFRFFENFTNIWIIISKTINHWQPNCSRYTSDPCATSQLVLFHIPTHRFHGLSAQAMACERKVSVTFNWSVSYFCEAQCHSP
jgi:hypothetical protein